MTKTFKCHEFSNDTKWHSPEPGTCPFPSWSPPRAPSPSSGISSHSLWQRSCAWSTTQVKLNFIELIPGQMIPESASGEEKDLLTNVAPGMEQKMIIHTKSQEQCSIDYLKLMVLSTCGRQTWPHWVPRGFFYSRPSRLHGASNAVTWTSNTLVASWQVLFVTRSSSI